MPKRKTNHVCSLCLRRLSSSKKVKENKYGMYLCKVCKRRSLIDDRGFVRKKRNKKSPSKLQRSVRLTLLEIFRPYEICEDVFFYWNRSIYNALLQYDFYIPNLDILIEVQGQHHYMKVGKFHMTDADLRGVKQRDKLKKHRAKQMNFTFYTIKYDEDYRDIIIKIYNDHVIRR
jgi:hypothetical protein